MESLQQTKIKVQSEFQVHSMLSKRNRTFLYLVQYKFTNPAAQRMKLPHVNLKHRAL